MLGHTRHLTRHDRDALTRAYNHDLIITRDELPNILDCLNVADDGKPVDGIVAPQE
jgi:hypothetical protein